MKLICSNLFQTFITYHMFYDPDKQTDIIIDI